MREVQPRPGALRYPDASQPGGWNCANPGDMWFSSVTMMATEFWSPGVGWRPIHAEPDDLSPPAADRPLPPADPANDAHAPEFAALRRFLAVRDSRPDAQTLRRAESDLSDSLRLPSGLDRVRDAFAQRLARQKTGGDIKGAAATESAVRLIDDVTRT